jgi:hypothetical protein
MRGNLTRCPLTDSVAVGVNVAVGVLVDGDVAGCILVAAGVFVNVGMGASVGADIDAAGWVGKGVTESIFASNRFSNLFATP